MDGEAEQKNQFALEKEKLFDFTVQSSENCYNGDRQMKYEFHFICSVKRKG